jgi:hypothetical protein
MTIKAPMKKHTSFKDIMSNALSGVALVISCAVAFYTYCQLNIDSSTEKYEFWKHITSSLNEQSTDSTELYPILLSQTESGEHLYSEIHNGKIMCRNILSTTPDSRKCAADVDACMARADEGEKYFNKELFIIRVLFLKTDTWQSH